MKKCKFLLILALFLSTPAFADEGDGTTPAGGKTCPSGQTVCREVPADESYIKTFSDWLIDLFS